MLGRTPGNIVAVRPLRQGVISDYTVTEKMLKYFIQKATGKRSFRRPRIAVCVPSGVTEVEKKATASAWLELAISCAKVPIKYCADELRRQQKEEKALLEAAQAMASY